MLIYSKIPGLLILLFFITSNACRPYDRKVKGFVVNGHLSDLENGIATLAKLDLNTNERVYIDSTRIIDGQFTFKGQVKGPYLHSIFINNDGNKIHFFLENSVIDISGNLKDLPEIKIIGSREDSLFRSYQEDDIFDRKKGMEIMLNYPDYSYAAFTAYYQFQIHNIPTDTMTMIMNGFKESARTSLYYPHLENLYSTIKQVAISAVAPNFLIPDTSGKKIDLKHLRGNYILIDFWASWCLPCRAANPQLVEVYHQFSEHNFTIVGISVDNNEKNWKKAIKKDRLPWINLSNLKGWDNVSHIYGVKAVPQNFLLDPDGIILEKNIEPKQLMEKLNMLFSD